MGRGVMQRVGVGGWEGQRGEHQSVQWHGKSGKA